MSMKVKSLSNVNYVSKDFQVSLLWKFMSILPIKERSLILAIYVNLEVVTKCVWKNIYLLFMKERSHINVKLVTKVFLTGLTCEDIWLMYMDERNYINAKTSVTVLWENKSNVYAFPWIPYPRHHSDPPPLSFFLLHIKLIYLTSNCSSVQINVFSK